MKQYSSAVWLGLIVVATSGCSLPISFEQPLVHNPFPQISKVAVAPFFNLSTEPTVDGRQFALAYFNELQSVPGYEVLPVGVVETTMVAHRISLTSPEDARRLAKLLDVDAVIIGAVTDFSPYYPPRCALQVEWYSGNDCFHPIPPGYGLPWGTEDEKHIPKWVAHEAEFAMARAQLESQTPRSPGGPPEPSESTIPRENQEENDVIEISYPAGYVDLGPPDSVFNLAQQHANRLSAASGVQPAGGAPLAPVGGVVQASCQGPACGNAGPGGWPPGVIPPCLPSRAPVLKHTRTYNGNDVDFTFALENYLAFKDDKRFPGCEVYLRRTDDFIRFCCHLHVVDMLSARGGAQQTRVVWKWFPSR